jgi:hypothetical protein
MVREAFASGFLSKSEAQKLVRSVLISPCTTLSSNTVLFLFFKITTVIRICRIDVERSGAVYDFIVCCGWIPAHTNQQSVEGK